MNMKIIVHLVISGFYTSGFYPTLRKSNGLDLPRFFKRYELTGSRIDTSLEVRPV